jgi:DNA-binding response OmpR family regulator
VRRLWPEVVVMRVLLIEDDDDARSLMEIVLAERGHDVAAFADAESAWSSSR